jgi:hypothetical protein
MLKRYSIGILLIVFFCLFIQAGIVTGPGGGASVNTSVPNFWTKNNFFSFLIVTNPVDTGDFGDGSGVNFMDSSGNLQGIYFNSVSGITEFPFTITTNLQVQGYLSAGNLRTVMSSNLVVIVDQVNGQDGLQFNYPDGPQANNGFAFKSITNAVAFVAQWYDMGGHDVIFSITNGTYNEAIDCEYLVGSRFAWFIGNTNTWGATTIRGNTGNQPTFQSINGNCKIRLRGLKMSSQCSTSPTFILAASNGGNISLDGFDELSSVGNAGSKQMVASAGGVIQINKSFVVSAGASECAYCVGGGFIYANATNVLTFSNSCAFTSAFAEVDEPGYQEWLNTLFVNTNLVTGPRYMVQHAGFIRTVASDTRGFNDLPGSSSGVQQLGGLYNQAKAESSLTVSSGFESLVQNGQAPNGIVVTGSVFNFTNTFFVNINVFMELGSVSSVKLNGTIIFQQSNVTIPMQTGDILNVTYSSAPTMSWKPQ